MVCACPGNKGKHPQGCTFGGSSIGQSKRSQQSLGQVKDANVLEKIARP
jgi:hypothetical protein